MLVYIPDAGFDNRFDENGSSKKYWDKQIAEKERMIKNAFKGGVLKLAIGVLKSAFIAVAGIAATRVSLDIGIIKIFAALTPAVAFTESYVSYVQAKQKFTEAEKAKREVFGMKLHKKCDESFSLEN